MKKGEINIAKEIFIIILLTILSMLVLAVALYDFIPNDINVSEGVEYTADSSTTSIKQEIAYTNGGDTTADEEQMVTSLKSYSIQASDLTVYGQKNLYNSGNSNPFDYAEEATPPENTTTTEQPATNQTTNAGEVVNTTQPAPTNQTTTASNSTVGTFFESPTSK